MALAYLLAAIWVISLSLSVNAVWGWQIALVAGNAAMVLICAANVVAVAWLRKP